MGEVKSNRLIPHRVSYWCDKCKTGSMVYTKENTMTHRPQGFRQYYPHKCTNCDETNYFEKKYPYIDYEFTDEPVSGK